MILANGLCWAAHSLPAEDRNAILRLWLPVLALPRREAALCHAGRVWADDPGRPAAQAGHGPDHGNATVEAGLTSLGKEADAFWRGVVEHYGKW